MKERRVCASQVNSVNFGYLVGRVRTCAIFLFGLDRSDFCLFFYRTDITLDLLMRFVRFLTWDRRTVFRFLMDIIVEDA